MRNILEYPITKEEVKSYLSDALEQVDHERKHGEVLFGDMRPLIGRKLLDKIDEIYEIIDKN